MKRNLSLLAAAFVVAFTIVTCAGAQQSLGEVARQQRQSKRPSSARVITNDDIAMAAAPAPDAAAPAAADEAKSDKSGKSDAAAAPGAEDKAKLAASFKAKADEQKKNIAQLERELDVAQREYRLKVAVYYADVGNNLRDSKKWAEDDRKQRAELDDRQKAVAAAKQKLADIQEEARKAGARAE
ncbi:MAG TPA: hypothetical protein VF840_11490 [Terriglobales bacterium]